MVNANTLAFDDADSLMRIGSWDHWERGMAISADVSPVVAEDHGRKLGVRGVIVFVFARFESGERDG